MNHTLIRLGSYLGVLCLARGYTGVAMQFGELGLASKTQPAGAAPVIVSCVRESRAIV